MNHLIGELLHSEMKATATFVHYKGGSQALQDLIAGRINVHPGSLPNIMPLVKAGKAKPIVGLSLVRAPQLPEIKTANEQGFPDFEQPNYTGFVTTAGTHPAIVEKLSAELRKIARLPDVAKVLDTQGSLVVASTPAEFSKYISTQVARWTKVVKDKNIKQE